MSLSFPNDLLQKRAHFCKIDALRPVQTADNLVRDASRLRVGPFDQGRDQYGREENREVASSIYLPIPIELTQGVQEHDIDTAANLLGFFKGVAETATGVGNALLAGVNRSINIGHYIVYTAPKFKKIDFTWTFIPRNSRDSELLSFICLWLQYYSSPSSNPMQMGGSADEVFERGVSTVDGIVAGGQALMALNVGPAAAGVGDLFNAVTFEYPNEFRISFLHDTGEGAPQNILLPQLKTGYISSLEIKHFDEEGSPTAFFRNTKYPVATTITFSLQENELNVKSDYERALWEARRTIENRAEPLGDTVTNGGE